MIDVPRCFEDLRAETHVSKLNVAALRTLEKMAEHKDSSRHVLFEILVKAGYIAAGMWLASSPVITSNWLASSKD